MGDLAITVSVKDGRVSLTGPLADRELCLKLLAEGLRVALTMKPPAPAPAIEIPDATLAAGLLTGR